MRALIQESFGIQDEALVSALVKSGKRERVRHGTLLVNAGEIQAQLPVLISGVFRGFVVDQEGREVTDCFVYTPGEPIVGCGGFEEPALASIEALKDGEVFLIPILTVESLMEEHQELMGCYNRLLLAALRRHWELKVQLLKGSSMERYQWFLRTYPDLVGQVSHKYISSFLGMTPVTFSRLRQRCREETGSSTGFLEE